MTNLALIRESPTMTTSLPFSRQKRAQLVRDAMMCFEQSTRHPWLRLCNVHRYKFMNLLLLLKGKLFCTGRRQAIGRSCKRREKVGSCLGEQTGEWKLLWRCNTLRKKLALKWEWLQYRRMGWTLRRWWYDVKGKCLRRTRGGLASSSLLRLLTTCWHCNSLQIQRKH